MGILRLLLSAVAIATALSAPALAAPVTKHPSSQAPQASPAVSLDSLLQEAASRHPGVRAARERYMAARARIAGEGLRPDPMIETGVMSLIGLMGPSVTVAQTLPLGGKLDLERQTAEIESRTARLTHLAALNEVLAEVKRTYFDLYYSQQAAAILDRNKLLLQQMSRIAGAKYAVGQGKQADVVRTNTELADILHEAVIVRQQREAATARLMGLLNRPLTLAQVQMVGTLLPPAQTSERGRAPDAALAEAEAHNPDIAMAKTEVALGEAALALAKTIAIPDLTARLGVGRAYMDMGWQTVVTGMVGANLPFESRKREVAAVEAAEADLAARRSSLDDRRRQVQVRIQETLTQIRHLEEQVALYRTGILPQSRLALQTELTNYQVNRSDFDAVVAARLGLFRYEREQQEAITDYHKMLADLDMLTGRAIAPQMEEHP